MVAASAQETFLLDPQVTAELLTARGCHAPRLTLWTAPRLVLGGRASPRSAPYLAHRVEISRIFHRSLDPRRTRSCCSSDMARSRSAMNWWTGELRTSLPWRGPSLTSSTADGVDCGQGQGSQRKLHASAPCALQWAQLPSWLLERRDELVAFGLPPGSTWKSVRQNGEIRSCHPDFPIAVLDAA
jgi:hypothetical protein